MAIGLHQAGAALQQCLGDQRIAVCPGRMHQRAESGTVGQIRLGPPGQQQFDLFGTGGKFRGKGKRRPPILVADIDLAPRRQQRRGHLRLGVAAHRQGQHADLAKIAAAGRQIERQRRHHRQGCTGLQKLAHGLWLPTIAGGIAQRRPAARISRANQRPRLQQGRHRLRRGIVNKGIHQRGHPAGVGNGGRGPRFQQGGNDTDGSAGFQCQQQGRRPGTVERIDRRAGRHQTEQDRRIGIAGGRIMQRGHPHRIGCRHLGATVDEERNRGRIGVMGSHTTQQTVQRHADTLVQACRQGGGRDTRRFGKDQATTLGIAGSIDFLKQGDKGFVPFFASHVQGTAAIDIAGIRIGPGPEQRGDLVDQPNRSHLHQQGPSTHILQIGIRPRLQQGRQYLKLAFGCGRQQGWNLAADPAIGIGAGRQQQGNDVGCNLAGTDRPDQGGITTLGNQIHRGLGGEQSLTGPDIAAASRKHQRGLTASVDLIWIGSRLQQQGNRRRAARIAHRHHQRSLVAGTIWSHRRPMLDQQFQNRSVGTLADGDAERSFIIGGRPPDHLVRSLGQHLDRAGVAALPQQQQQRGFARRRGDFGERPASQQRRQDRRLGIMASRQHQRRPVPLVLLVGTGSRRQQRLHHRFALALAQRLHQWRHPGKIGAIDQRARFHQRRHHLGIMIAGGGGKQQGRSRHLRIVLKQPPHLGNGTGRRRPEKWSAEFRIAGSVANTLQKSRRGLAPGQPGPFQRQFAVPITGVGIRSRLQQGLYHLDRTLRGSTAQRGRTIVKKPIYPHPSLDQHRRHRGIAIEFHRISQRGHADGVNRIHTRTFPQQDLHHLGIGIVRHRRHQEGRRPRIGKPGKQLANLGRRSLPQHSINRPLLGSVAGRINRLDQGDDSRIRHPARLVKHRPTLAIHEIDIGSRLQQSPQDRQTALVDRQHQRGLIPLLRGPDIEIRTRLGQRLDHRRQRLGITLPRNHNLQHRPAIRGQRPRRPRMLLDVGTNLRLRPGRHQGKIHRPAISHDLDDHQHHNAGNQQSLDPGFSRRIGFFRHEHKKPLVPMLVARVLLLEKGIHHKVLVQPPFKSNAI